MKSAHHSDDQLSIPGAASLPVAVAAAVFTLLLFLSPLKASAQSPGYSQPQSGTITGKVVDAETGEAIIGVNVLVAGTTRGDATDIDGRYTIRRIPAGIHAVRFSYISHATKTVTGVRVEGGEVTRIDVEMQPESYGLGEITVTAEANRSGDAGLLAMQKRAVAVQDGLSSEQLRRSGAGDVADAMQQVSGVSVMNGRDLYIRGLGNRYSNIQLDGGPVPSTDPNRKEAPVDLFSSSMIDHIVVQKTWSPDQTGEFSGGSVQIVTREFPDARNLGFSWSTSINTRSVADGYLSYSGGATDFLGYDDGYRRLPSQVEDGRITGSEEAEEVSRQLHSVWNPHPARAIPSQKLSVNYANRFDGKLPVGVVSSFSYKYDNRSRAGEIYRYIQNHNPATGQTSIGADYRNDTGTQSAALNAMVNLFLKPSGSSRIGLKNLYSNSAKKESRTIGGDYYNYRGQNRQTVLGFEQRSVFSSTLSYENYFHDFMESTLETSLGWSKAVRSEPDRRSVQYAENTDGQYEVLLADRGNFHFFSDQNDRNLTGKADYRFRAADRLTIGAGAMGLLKERDFSARRLLYQDLDHSLTDEQRLMGPEELFAPGMIGSGQIDLTENTQSYDSYLGEQQLEAGYLSANWQATDRLSMEGGLRVEHSRQSVNGRVLIEETDLLPALNTTFRVSESANLRGALSMTLARPEFRELSDFNFRDFVGGRTVYGNPGLERTRIYNADLRYEIYPVAGDLLAAGVFYKQFHNPIEIAYRITQNNEVTYINVAQADLFGAELELHRQVTDRFRLRTALSWIHSRVGYSEGQAQARQATEDRPMHGQSPYTLSMGATWKFPGIGLESHLSYETFGRRISAVGNAQQPGDEYEQPFHNLGLNLSKRIGSSVVSLEMQNMLNQAVEYRQGGVVTTRYRPGMTFTLGFSWPL